MVKLHEYADGKVKVWNDDWFKIYTMAFEPNSIDLIVTSIPYGILEKVGWDFPIDLLAVEGSFNRVLKENGLIVFFCNLDLMVKTISFCQSWEKRALHVAIKNLSQPISKFHPLPDVEFVLILKKKGTPTGSTAWHPLQFHPGGKPYLKKGYISESPTRRMIKNPISENKTGRRFITQSLPFTPKCQLLKAERSSSPCQLPEHLLRGLIRTYSNPGDVVLDPFMGSSGSAVISAAREGRTAYGVEMDKKIYDEAVNRIRKRSGVHQEKLALA